MREELGCPGHFICANDCRYRRHTQVENYRISTVGDLYFDKDPTRKTLGAGATSFFETLVFKLGPNFCDDNEGCKCREVTDWGEVDGRRYSTAGEAHQGHEEFVKKYEGKPLEEDSNER